MLSLLLDEQMSPQVAAQVQARNSEIPIQSVQTWQGENLRGQPDEQLLREAASAGFTLVTYDISTIMPVLIEWGTSGEDHGGVLFIDHLSISQGNLGGQVAALVQQWEAALDWDWTNVVQFLRAARDQK